MPSISDRAAISGEDCHCPVLNGTPVGEGERQFSEWGEHRACRGALGKRAAGLETFILNSISLAAGLVSSLCCEILVGLVQCSDS